jgi:ubiquinone/menaquinone biosynthesis C-methylase UbiE
MFSNPDTNVNQLGLLPGMHVADFGAGIGYHAIAIARAIESKGRVYAIDIQQDLLDRLRYDAQRLHITTIEVIHGDVEKLGGTRLRDASCDYILAANILFQMNDTQRKACLQEAKRILKPGGRFALIDWNDSYGDIGPHETTVFPPFEARQMFLSQGFSEERTLRAGDHHYGIIFRKI